MATTTIKDGFNGGSDNQLKVNSDGSINVNTSGGGGGSNVNLISVGGASINLGQTTEANSLPVVIASDQSPITVISSGSSTVSGTVTSNTAGLNAFQTSQYIIGLTSVHLAPTPLTNRSSISLAVEADPNVAVYIGNSSAVTVSTGYPLYNGSTIQLDLTPTGNIWAITATAGQTIAVLEIA